jgi:hypothetical protein
MGTSVPDRDGGQRGGDVAAGWQPAHMRAPLEAAGAGGLCPVRRTALTPAWCRTGWCPSFCAGGGQTAARNGAPAVYRPTALALPGGIRRPRRLKGATPAEDGPWRFAPMPTLCCAAHHTYDTFPDCRGPQCHAPAMRVALQGIWRACRAAHTAAVPSGVRLPLQHPLHGMIGLILYALRWVCAHPVLMCHRGDADLHCSLSFLTH